MKHLQRTTIFNVPLIAFKGLFGLSLQSCKIGIADVYISQFLFHILLNQRLGLGEELTSLVIQLIMNIAN
jgi:hypothetical protein